MPTILVIDDAPVIHWSVQAAVPEWTVLTALDGIVGLDLVRQHGDTLDLIVLDIDMPRLDGYDTCLQIRTLCPTLPILPFTAMVVAIPLLRELGCLPVLLKGGSPEQLQAALYAACGAVGSPVQPGPAVLAFAQQAAAARETHARSTLETSLPVVLFASAVATRLGLYHLLAAAGMMRIYEATSDGAARTLLGMQRIGALVAAGRDSEAASELAAAFSVPLLLIAATPAEAQVVARGYAGVSVITEEAAATPATLQRVLANVAAGEIVAAPSLEAALRSSGLTSQEQALVLLAISNLDDAAAAQQLGVNPTSIPRYYRRIYSRLGLNSRAALRTWAQGQVEALYSS